MKRRLVKRVSNCQYFRESMTPVDTGYGATIYDSRIWCICGRFDTKRDNLEERFGEDVHPCDNCTKFRFTRTMVRNEHNYQKHYNRYLKWYRKHPEEDWDFDYGK